jgi:hypothetical protein
MKASTMTRTKQVTKRKQKAATRPMETGSPFEITRSWRLKVHGEPSQAEWREFGETFVRMVKMYVERSHVLRERISEMEKTLERYQGLKRKR